MNASEIGMNIVGMWGCCTLPLFMILTVTGVSYLFSVAVKTVSERVLKS